MHMKRLTALSVLMLLPILHAYADNESPAKPEKAKSAKQQARDAVERLIKAKDWRSAKPIQMELAAIGEAAVHPILRQAKRHEDEKVRLWCYKLLTTHFAEEAKEFIAEKGLSDESQKVRYHCVWHCGEAKVFGAHRTLRRLMQDENQPSYIRNAATKSLAELGEPDVIKELVVMMSSNSFMPRHMGNIGAKALTGKNLNDFNDYNYREGAFVSGGFELITTNPYPPDVHKRIANRHRAMADYCRWLEKKNPQVFKHLYAPS